MKEEKKKRTIIGYYNSKESTPTYYQEKHRPAYYQVCPNCGATLDFGETCDCNKIEKGIDT